MRVLLTLLVLKQLRSYNIEFKIRKLAIAI